MFSKIDPTNLKSVVWGIRPLRGNRIQLASRKEVEMQLIKKGMLSPEFRRRLVDDPKNVLQVDMGIDLPGELEIHVVEETATHIYYSLPCNPLPEYSPQDLSTELGLSLYEVALWTLQQHRSMPPNVTGGADLLAKAWTNPAFRKLLIDHPVQVIEEATGTTLPRDISVTVLEETPDCAYLILPNVVDLGVADFEDEDLWSTANLGPEFIAVASGNPNCMKFSCPFLSCTTTTRTTQCTR